jgi:organic hydroperoxide reductase OsmC/OhrA
VGSRTETVRSAPAPSRASTRSLPGQLAITGIELETEAEVAGLDEAEFRESAEQAKQNCPVSKVLSAVPIILKSATLSPVAAGRR